MKNSIKFLTAVAIAALSFAGCQKEEIKNPADNNKTVSFFARSIETKTAFGEPDGTSYPTLWTENDSEVSISVNRASAKKADVTPSDDFKTASFDVELTDDESGSYTFEAVSPASALLGVSATNGLNIDVPTTQTPTAASVDEKAQILVAGTSAYDKFPSSVDLDFAHFTAYGKISIKNLEAGATISSISLTADSNWAGRWYYNNGVVSENSASASITINTTSASDNWFACAPVDLGGKDIKVTVVTDKGNYVKSITIPAGKKFESGKIAKFAVDFDGITTGTDVVYTLVSSLDDLTVGSEVIIAAKDYDFAMSTTQNSNNRGQASVTKTDNTIKNPGDGVQVLTLAKGSAANTVAFYTGSGYLNAVSGSNYLRTQANIATISSWTIAISSGSANIYNASATTYCIQYNSSSKMFSCYKTTQKEVSIYKKNGSGTTEAIFDGSVPEIPEYASLAELVAAGTPTTDGETVTVTLSDEVITKFYTTTSGYTNGLFVDVDGQEVEIYCNDVPSTWAVGGKISGTVTCPWKLYKSTWELCPTSWKDFSYTAPASGDAKSHVLLCSEVDNVSAYSTTEKSVVAADGATWKITGYGSSDDNIQLGKGGANYILTPSSTAAIKSIEVECTSSYYLAVANTSGTEITASQPSDGKITFDLSASSETQVKLIARRASGTSNAAVYITKVTVNY